MVRRSSPLLLVLGLCIVVASCDNVYGGASGSGSTPVGIVLMNARTKGSGYTTYPRVNFYAVSSATFELSSVATDTCVAGPNDSIPGITNVPQIGGGPFLMLQVSGDTASLFKAATGDQTYHPDSLSGIPFTPGDSVFLQISGDAAGFPVFLDGLSRTAEPFTITRPVIPPVGESMTVNWSAATDLNATMLITMLYNTPPGSGLNSAIVCDFHDTGTGVVQPYLLNALGSSNVSFVLLAQRVRSNLQQAQTTSGYLNIISTFEVPTPVSP